MLLSMNFYDNEFHYSSVICCQMPIQLMMLVMEYSKSPYKKYRKEMIYDN